MRAWGTHSFGILSCLPARGQQGAQRSQAEMQLRGPSCPQCPAGTGACSVLTCPEASAGSGDPVPRSFTPCGRDAHSGPMGGSSGPAWGPCGRWAGDELVAERRAASQGLCREIETARDVTREKGQRRVRRAASASTTLARSAAEAAGHSQQPGPFMLRTVLQVPLTVSPTDARV